MLFSPVLFRFFFSLHNLFPFSFSAFFSHITSWSFFLFGKFHSPLRRLVSFFAPVCFYVLSSNSSPDIKFFSPLCLSALQLLNLLLSLHLIYPKIFSILPLFFAPRFYLSSYSPIALLLKRSQYSPCFLKPTLFFLCSRPLVSYIRPSSFLTTHFGYHPLPFYRFLSCLYNQPSSIISGFLSSKIQTFIPFLNSIHRYASSNIFISRCATNKTSIFSLPLHRYFLLPASPLPFRLVTFPDITALHLFSFAYTYFFLAVFGSFAV